MQHRRRDALKRVEIKSAAALRDWLSAHHTQSESIWLVRFKKSCPDKYVSYDEVVDEAICFGWIDSLPRKLDEHRTMILLSPRRAGSGWSAKNKQRVARLEAERKMHPFGRAVVAAAQTDKSWDFLNDVDALIEPDDLASSLNENYKARQNFDRFSRSSRRGILEWIKTAKTPETRAKRVLKTVSLAASGIKANH